MKRDCYPELVEVFYNNVKEVDDNVHSRVKGLDIVINNDTWLKIVDLKDEGCLSHQPHCLQYKLTRKTKMFKDCMRYRGRLTLKDVYLLNATIRRIPTNWVVVFKWHILDVGINNWHGLPYDLFISKVLEQSGVNLTRENKLTCSKANLLGKSLTTLNGKMDEIFKHYVEISTSSEESKREDVDDVSEESSTKSFES
ncbi:hypothetical protein V8G54_028832 [Vigna mungo]|uniref:Uncharacterized protein n=1 Tax=Vigna mungo TaxID=3915 RepID=A0AAQ3MTB4_VIGMU